MHGQQNIKNKSSTLTENIWVYQQDHVPA